MKPSIMFKYFTVLICCAITLSASNAQNEDYIWPLGNNGGSSIEQLEQDLEDSSYIWIPFNFDFNMDPMNINYVIKRIPNSSGTLASICDKDGNLFCYGHGRSIFDSNDNFAVNGDTICYDPYWELWNYEGLNRGYRIFQGMILLPFPGYRDSVFYMTLKYDHINDVQTGVYWGIITGYKDGSRAKVVSKDNVIDHTFLGSGMTKAVRHANGRDWWIILISGDNVSYYIYKLDPLGLKLWWTQTLGKKQSGFNSGNAAFSYDGAKYAVIDGRYIPQQAVISIFDFDRCSGRLSNPHHKENYLP